MATNPLPEGLRKSPQTTVTEQVLARLAATPVPAPMQQALSAVGTRTQKSVADAFADIDFAQPTGLLAPKTAAAPAPPEPPEPSAAPKAPAARKREGKSKVQRAAGAAKGLYRELRKEVKRRRAKAEHLVQSLPDARLEIEIEGGFGKDARHALDRAKERIDSEITARMIDEIEALGRKGTPPEKDFHIKLLVPGASGNALGGFAQFGYPGTSKQPVLMTVLGPKMTPRGAAYATTVLDRDKTAASLGHLTNKVRGAVNQVGDAGVRLQQRAQGALNSVGDAGVRLQQRAQGALNSVGDAGVRVQQQAQGALNSVGDAGVRVQQQAQGAVDRTGAALRDTAQRAAGAATAGKRFVDRVAEGGNARLMGGLEAANRGIGHVQNPRVRAALAQGMNAGLRAGPRRAVELADGLVADATLVGSPVPGLVSGAQAAIEGLTSAVHGDYAGALQQVPLALQSFYPMLTGTRGNVTRSALDQVLIDGAQGVYGALRPKAAAAPPSVGAAPSPATVTTPSALTGGGSSIPGASITPVGPAAPSMTNPAALSVAPKAKSMPSAPKSPGTQMPIAPIKVADVRLRPHPAGERWIVEADDIRITTDTRDSALRAVNRLTGARAKVALGSVADAVMAYAAQAVAADEQRRGVAPALRPADPAAPPVGLGPLLPSVLEDIQPHYLPGKLASEKRAMLPLLTQMGKRALPRVGRALAGAARAVGGTGKSVAARGLSLAGDASTLLDFKSLADATISGKQKLSPVNFRVAQ